jgi:hypothetical protein
MSQDYTQTTSRKQRRAARANRNRPVLVTDSTQEQEAQPATDSPVATSAPEAEAPAPITPTPAPKTRVPRLPNFFSTVGKTEQNKQLAQEEKEKEDEVAQARIARATRKVSPTTKTPTVKTEKALAATKATEEKPEKTTRPAASASRPAPTRPMSTFKTRYIFGMVIYLIVAQVIGVGITGFFQQQHLDAVLAQFSLFGGTVIIRTSTVLYLIFLVVILVLLARFDLLPRSLSAMANTPTNTGKSTSSRNTTDSGSGGNSQPLIKQGVSGADDALYRQYRVNQRKKK